MVAMTVKSNIKAFSKYLNSVQNKQLPFATAGALNDTAFAVRKRIVDRTYPRAFKVRKKNFAKKAFRVKKANKKHLTSAVFDQLKKNSLVLHTKGGIKKPRGRHIAVPSSNIKRTASGKIGKAKQPRVLLSGSKSFKGKTRTGKPAIYAKQRKKVVLMYTLANNVPIKKRFDFYGDAERTAKRSFNYHFKKRLAHALRTAR